MGKIIKSLIIVLLLLSCEEKPEYPEINEVVKYAMRNLNKGVSPDFTLGKYKFAPIRWRVLIDPEEPVSWGLMSKPGRFKSGSKIAIYGHPSPGLDKTKFWMFCEKNKGRKVEIEGILLSATDHPFALSSGEKIAIEVEINSISLIESTPIYPLPYSP